MTTDLETKYNELSAKYDDLQSRYEELRADMGSELNPLPDSRIGGYLSHFRMTFEFLRDGMGGRIISVVSPLAVQSVSWSSPFIYEGPSANHRVTVPIPRNSTLPDTISESDFFSRPSEYFQEGKEAVWLQILNLDARMDSEMGPIRIILGETLKREYPDIFEPSLGVAQSLSGRGFPARLFFNPYAVIETPFGAFRAIHGTLAYGRVTKFPPVGTPVSICNCIPVESVDEVREMVSNRGVEMRTMNLTEIDESRRPFARIIALSHPIDMELQISGDEAFDIVERAIEYGGRSQS